MIRSYLKILVRNMVRQKAYSIITILGLTVGLTFAMLIGVFVWSEMQVNQNLKDVDRLDLVETEYQRSEGSMPTFLCSGYHGRACC